MSKFVWRHRRRVNTLGEILCVIRRHRHAEAPSTLGDRDRQRIVGEQGVAEVEQHATNIHAASVEGRPTSLP